MTIKDTMPDAQRELLALLAVRDWPEIIGHELHFFSGSGAVPEEFRNLVIWRATAILVSTERLGVTFLAPTVDPHDDAAVANLCTTFFDSVVTAAMKGRLN
jgi:hypothetical protein